MAVGVLDGELLAVGLPVDVGRAVGEWVGPLVGPLVGLFVGWGVAEPLD